jgi:cytochrome c
MEHQLKTPRPASAASGLGGLRGRGVRLAIASLVFFLAADLSVCVIQAQRTRNTSARAGAERTSSDVARGKYLVENVAMCGQCHTPRDSSGALDQSRALEGAPVFMKPADGNADWPLTAPRIGGTPPASDADMVKLLTTGVWTNGQPLRFPMMPFRMSQADAEAVVAYLRSMQPQPKP